MALKDNYNENIKKIAEKWIEELLIHENKIKGLGLEALIDDQNFGRYPEIVELVDKAMIKAMTWGKKLGETKIFIPLGSAIMDMDDKEHFELVQLCSCRFLNTLKYYERYTNNKKDTVAGKEIVERGLLKKEK